MQAIIELSVDLLSISEADFPVAVDEPGQNSSFFRARR